MRNGPSKVKDHARKREAVLSGNEERLQSIELQLAGLRQQVDELEVAIRSLEERQALFRHPLEVVLRQRGLPILSSGLDNRALPLYTASLENRRVLYRMMRRYSFRLFLRDLIQFPAAETYAPLTRYCSPRSVRSYLGLLEPMGIVALGPGTAYRFLPKPVASFGPTLEWYVSEIMAREFLAPSLFNIRLDHTRFGGDYDVMALLSDQLIYIEVKSSPPRGVELPAIHAFLNRLRDLQPQIAVFLVDTELRMLDKMVPLFDESLRSHRGGVSPGVMERVVDEIFQVGHSLFITNSRKGIYSNLRVCIRHAFHHQDCARLPVGPSESGVGGG